MQFVYLYEEHQRERQFREYCAALAPFFYLQANCKERPDLSDVMLMYGEDGNGGEGMGSDDMKMKVLEFQAKFGGKIIKGD